MYRVHVHADIRAPIDRVFDAVSDHESFISGPEIDRCKVTTPGRDEKNGLGAIRQVEAAGLWFEEEIVRFDRPRRFDYLIREVRRGKRALPMTHELGSLEFSERGGATRVEWRSHFRVAIPLLGGVIERTMGPKVSAGFEKILQRAKAKLESEASAA